MVPQDSKGAEKGADTGAHRGAHEGAHFEALPALPHCVLVLVLVDRRGRGRGSGTTLGRRGSGPADTHTRTHANTQTHKHTNTQTRGRIGMLSESPRKFGLSQQTLQSGTPTKGAREPEGLDMHILDYHLHQCIALRLHAHENTAALREAFEVSTIITSMGGGKGWRRCEC